MEWWRLKHGTHWTLELPHLESSWNSSTAQRKELWPECPNNCSASSYSLRANPQVSSLATSSPWFSSAKGPWHITLNLVKALSQSSRRKVFTTCHIYPTYPKGGMANSLQHLPSWLNGAALKCAHPKTVCSSTGSGERWSNEIVFY